MSWGKSACILARLFFQDIQIPVYCSFGSEEIKAIWWLFTISVKDPQEYLLCIPRQYNEVYSSITSEVFGSLKGRTDGEVYSPRSHIYIYSTFFVIVQSSHLTMSLCLLRETTMKPFSGLDQIQAHHLQWVNNFYNRFLSFLK